MIAVLWLALACSTPTTAEGLPAPGEAVPVAGQAAPEAAAPAAAAAPADAPVPEKARRAGEIARAIEAAPDRVDAILKEHGTTRAEYEALLFEIAGDPQLSLGYGRTRSGK